MIFLYYVPGATEQTIRTAPAFTSGGLQIVFADCMEYISFNESKGPDGTSGLLMYALPTSKEKPFALRYRPADQTWIDCETHWIGIQNDNPPQPEGLQRRKIVDSYTYTLADQREWKCPRIRRGANPLLPAYWKVNKGTFMLEVKEQYQDVWEASEEWSSARVTFMEAFLICVTCLGLNYRVGANELSAMNALDSESAHDVILAALDEQFFLDLIANQKKNELDTSEESEP